jgi:DNA invertase Pin-like site-specific DNA recombinase
MRVAIYTRISQDRSGDSVSPAAQRRLCANLVKEKNLELVDFGEPLNDTSCA